MFIDHQQLRLITVFLLAQETSVSSETALLGRNLYENVYMQPMHILCRYASLLYVYNAQNAVADQLEGL